MLKKDVEIGGRYAATVSGQRTEVEILYRQNYRRGGYYDGSYSGRTINWGGWRALNLATGKEVRIMTAARLTPIPAR